MAGRPQAPEPLLAINRWFTGLVTQRSPLNTPFSFVGLNMIQRNDALIGGLNVEVTNRHTLARRPGFPSYCTTAFASNETALAFSSATLVSNVYTLVDTNLKVYSFGSGPILTPLFTKSTTAQTFFQQVGNKLYMANGSDLKKFDGSAVTPQGIAAPVAAPTVSTNNTQLNFWEPGAAQTVIILDSNGNWQKGLSGNNGTQFPMWRTGFLSLTMDGTKSWSYAGPNAPWQPSTAYADGQAIADSNGNLQVAAAAGTSGSAAPSWNSTIGGTTTDGTITWIESGVGSGTDNGSGLVKIQSGYQWGYCYHTSDGHVSTMSPATSPTGPGIGGVFSIQLGGAYSTQGNCDQVWIFRTDDGGSVFYRVATVSNNTAGGTWNYTDTTLDSGLNNEIIAPLEHSNDPPPAGMTILAYYMDRLWGAVGNTLYFTAGPDTITGDPNQCWPGNAFVFPSNITCLAPTSAGLVVFLADQMQAILGGPQTLSFYAQPLLQKFGILSPNCLAQDGDQLYVYTSARQYWSLNANTGKSEDGFAIGDVLGSTFDPTKTYLTLHRAGEDVGVFLSDGSTNMLRYALNSSSWCTIAQPVGGVAAIGSIETALGVYGLMMARPGGSSLIYERSLTTFQDGGSSYPAFATIGSLNLSAMGMPPAQVGGLVVQAAAAGGGTMPTVGVLANEISGMFVNVPFTVPDPHENPASSSLFMQRFDWMGIQQQLPALVRHMQVQLTWGSTNTPDELFGLGILPMGTP